MSRYCFLVVLVWMCVIIGAVGTGYCLDVYVSAGTGLDSASNDGSMGSPWASIGYAVVNVPGTASVEVNIHVAVGTYVENLALSGYQSLLGGYNVDFSGRNVDDRENPLYTTIIDGGDTDEVICCGGSEDFNKVISGFTIQNGHGTYGGGIDANFSAVVIENNTFYDNYTDYEGGGVYGCHGTIRNNIFDDNWAAENGGAIGYGFAAVEDNYIYDNYAAINGGGLHNCAGTISGNEILENYASGNGGGLSECDGSIISNLIHDNEAHVNGGGLSVCNPTGSSRTIGLNIIYNNWADSNGGGFYDCDFSIQNNIIYDNYAEGYGGAFAECDGDIFNNTVHGNTAEGVAGGFHNCNGTITNNIIWDNYGAGFLDPFYVSSAPTYCCIEGWSSGGPGNISDDPMFVQADLKIFHLLPGSPCIDSGSATGTVEEFEGDVRPHNLVYDIGADEYTGADTTPPTFDVEVRQTPIDTGVYLEWVPGTDASEPLYYNLYVGTAPGVYGTIPSPSTLNTYAVKESQKLSDHYAVLQACDAYGNETSTTDEITYYPGASMMNGLVYNHDFEFLPPGSSPVKRGPPAGKPDGWLASGQDYGDKTTNYYFDPLDPYEGLYSAWMITSGIPVNPDDLSIASLTSDNSIALEKDHTYAVSARVWRSQSQWARFILFTAGFGLIHTENIDALDNKFEESGWEVIYFYFRSPSNSNAYVRLDSIVTNIRTTQYISCEMKVDDVQVVDMGIETFTDTYNETPPPPQYGIRNRYFSLSTETECCTLGGIAYSCDSMPKRWNLAMAVDEGTNHAAGYPLWGEAVPPGLTNTSGSAGFVTAKAATSAVPAWPSIAADGVRINTMENNGQRHVLTFNYGAVGFTRPLLRAFMVNQDYSRYSSLFVDSAVGIPGNKMWPLSLMYTPAFGDEFVKVRFDNVTLGAAGDGVFTDEATIYIDNVVLGVVE